MQLPDFIQKLPALQIPFADDVVTCHAIQSDEALAVFFVFKQDFSLPPHSHKAQWGTVLTGQLELTIEGNSRIYGPGESYSIPDGAEHSGKAPAGTIVIDVFEEADRYSLVES